MDRPRQWRWVYFIPILHLSACFVSFVGYVIPSLQYIGILFTFILMADLPISLPAYALAWKYGSFAGIWIFVVGTLWWYLLSRVAATLLTKLIRRG
jgi:hypothetical protein